MAYSSDIDLSSIHKANNIDAEVPYELSWHFHSKMLLNSHKPVKSDQFYYNNDGAQTQKNSTKSDVNNNNFYAKLFRSNDDNFYSLHKGKSGTWP